MDFHGAELERTWVKLGATAAKGSTTVVLADRFRAGGRRPRDHHRDATTACRRRRGHPQRSPPPETEERIIRAIDGPRLTIDSPLACAHTATDVYRGEVALLSRNVVVESADPGGFAATPCIIAIPRVDLLHRVPASRQGREAG